MDLSTQIKHLSITDKFLIMEQIWDDLSKNADKSLMTPKWHLKVLNERENCSKFNDINDAKIRLQQKLK